MEQEKKFQWIDLCDDDDEEEEQQEYEQCQQKKIEEVKGSNSQNPQQNGTTLKSDTTLSNDQNFSLNKEYSFSNRDLNSSPIESPKKKAFLTTQSISEMIEQIEQFPDNHEYFINICNVDSSATIEDIRAHFDGIYITKVLQSVNKIGNFDLVVETKEEAIKLIQIGPGVLLILYFLFFLRLLKRENFL